ncbi:MAG: hypothetical protein OEW39_03455 [Deltaproteobacteria bacterium]|nr:hypothetical protein [Deltaproteobacteria bacterium]
MKDTTIGPGHIKPLADLRQSGKTTRKEQAQAPKTPFQETLASAQDQMLRAEKGAAGAQKTLTTQAVEEELRSASKQLEQMMLARQQIAKAYQMVKNTPPDEDNR